MKLKRMKKVNLYTDGACSGNPGPGGWGAILEYSGVEKELSGGAAETTNNRMELQAVIEGLEKLKEPCTVSVYTDSSYVVQAVTKGWVYKWRENGWMRNKKDPALNSDLWQELLSWLKIHTVEFFWVRGHAENEYNNRCDALAVSASKQFAKKTKK